MTERKRDVTIKHDEWINLNRKVYELKRQLTKYYNQRPDVNNANPENLPGFLFKLGQADHFFLNGLTKALEVQKFLKEIEEKLPELVVEDRNTTPGHLTIACADGVYVEQNESSHDLSIELNLECYKTGQPCKHDCKGLCRESC